MHRGKKREKVQLTEEEKIKIEHKGNQIMQMINDFLDIRQNITKSNDPFEHTTIMTSVAPELYTIFNLRKELILQKLEQESNPLEKIKILVKELEFLIPLQRQHPKSYPLWFHRQWSILLIAQQEKILAIEKSQVLEKELMLCNKMLEKDERNFHVWNYRNWICQVKYDRSSIQEMINFTKIKIENNFCNFSALHFRSKYLQEYYKRITVDKIQDDSNTYEEDHFNYKIPVSIIKQELEMALTGLYMQPNEQSLWLYQKWLVNNLIPATIVDLIVTNEENYIKIVVSLSQNTFLTKYNFHIFSKNNENITNIEDFTLKTKSGYKSAKIWIITISNDFDVNASQLTIKLQAWNKQLFLNHQELIESYQQNYSELVPIISSEISLIRSSATFQIENQTSLNVSENKYFKLFNEIINEEIKNTKEVVELENNIKYGKLQLLYFYSKSLNFIENYFNQQLYNESLNVIHKLIEEYPQQKIMFNYISQTIELRNVLLNLLKSIQQGNKLTEEQLKFQENDQKIISENDDLLYLAFRLNTIHIN